MKRSYKLPSWFLVLFLGLVSIVAPVKSHAQGVTSLGVDFWVGFMPDYLYPAENVRLFIGSATDNKVIVEVFNGSTIPVQTIVVNIKANTTATVKTTATAIWETRITENADYKAIHVTALNPIALYGFSNVTATSDGYLALPTPALGNFYYASCFYDDKYGGGLDDPLAGELLVIAPYDNTKVTINPSCDTRSDPSGTVSHLRKKPWTITLMKGQTYLVQSTGLHVGDDDLTGTSIQSDKPVGLLSGHQRVTIPVGYSGNSKDNLVEMIPPVDKWGTQYYDQPMAGRPICGDLIRLIAGDTGVVVTANGINQYTLNLPGDFIDVDNVLDPTVFSSANGKKFLTVQHSYSQGYLGDPAPADPFSIVMTPQEEFQKKMIFRTPGNQTGEPDYKNYATFIAPFDSLSRIQVNGKNLSSLGATVTQFPLRGTGGTVQMGASRVNLPSNVSFVCTSGAPFGCYLYGFTNVDGYGWPAGMALKIVSPDTLPPLSKKIVSCGDVIDTLYEIRHQPPLGTFSFEDSKISDIALITDAADLRHPNDPSYNYTLTVDPNFKTGDSTAAFTLTRIDPSKNAYAAVWASDKAGNDTVYKYNWVAPLISYNPGATAINPVTVGIDSCVTFKVINPATSNLDITNAKILGKSGQFRVQGGVGSIGPKDSMAVTVCFNPNDTTLSLDTLVLQTTCVPFKYPLLGIGVTPLIYADDLNFGAVDPGKTACKLVAIKNVGKATLIVNSQDLKSTDPDFSVDPAQKFPITIPPGGKAEVSFCFHPSHSGHFSTRVLYGTNNPAKFARQIKDTSMLLGVSATNDAELTYLQRNYDQVPCGQTSTLKDTLFNAGSRDAGIDNVKIIGPDAKYFSIVNAAPTTNFVLSPNSPTFKGIEYDVRYTPDAGALDSVTRYAQLVAYPTASENLPTVIANLIGKRRAPELTLGAYTADLGITQPNGVLTGTVHFRNTGNDVLTISTVTLTSSNPGAFSYTPAPPYTIQPGDSIAITVTYSTAKESIDQATLTGNPLGCASPVSVPMKAISNASSNLALGADFNTIWSCQPKTLMALYHSNNKGVNDILDSVAITSGGADFSIDFTKGKFRDSIVAGGTSILIPVIFHPANDGVKTGSVTFYVHAKTFRGKDTIEQIVRQLTGTGQSLQRTVGVGAATTGMTYQSIPNQNLDIPIMIDQDFAAAAPKDVFGYSFDIGWRRDLFQFVSFTVNGAALTATSDTYDATTQMETMHYQYLSTSPIAAGATLGHLTLVPQVSTDSTSPINLRNAEFLDANGAPVCFVQSATVNGLFQETPLCGNQTLRSILNNQGIPMDIGVVTPNPVTDKATITYHIAADMTGVSLIIYDALGNSVKRIVNNDSKKTGTYTAEFSSKDLSSGIYYARLTNGHATIMKSIVVQK